jgi:hypothetical protein
MIYRLSATDWQKDVVTTIIETAVRFVCLMAGRRAGKTFAARTSIVIDCLKKPGRKWWYIGNIGTLAREQFDAIVSHPALKNKIKKQRQQPSLLIQFKNGSSIMFRSWDRPDNLQGFGLDGVWCDEIQSWNGSRFWRIIRPLISDRRGKLVISGQHDGTESWYYKDLFEPGLPGGDPLYRSWSIPSWRGICFQSEAGKEELRIAKAQCPDLVWQVMYACVPTASEMALFRHEDLEAAKRGRPEEPIAGQEYIHGLDLGRVVDPSAHVILRGDAVVYAEKRPLGEKHEIGSEYAWRLHRRYNESMVIVDTTGGASGGRKEPDEYVKLYRDKIDTMRSFFWTYDSKRRIIESLCLAVEQRHIAIPAEFEELHRELSLYQYRLRSGRIEYSAPSGQHDDLVAALAMAWYARKWAGDSGLGAVPRSL